MTYVITQSCCNDAACVDVCPVDCIHPRPDEQGFDVAEMLHIDPSACVDCGACLERCPADAIVPDHELTVANRAFLDIARAHFARSVPSAPQARPLVAGRSVVSTTGALRVAIVGTGPSACYAARDLIECEGLDVHVSMFDRLPIFGGLIRYGVAPDHLRTKAVAAAFEDALPPTSVDLFLNVEIGRHISHAELLAAHHAVIYAVGASQGRALGIAGEGLPGSCSSADIVGWYNGHPDHAHHQFDLSAKRAVVIGNGNVALDIARLLVAGSDMHDRSDLAEHARRALADAAIEEVIVLGRRGPDQTAATWPELQALGNLPGVDVLVQDAGGLSLPVHADGTRKMAILADYAMRRTERGHRRIIFRYFRSPLAIEGEGRVEAVLLQNTACNLSQDDEASERLSCGLVISAVGFRSAPVPDLPFDDGEGVVFHRGGRVVHADGEALRGAYVAGWAKRGPSGVIGTNKRCSAETISTLLADFGSNQLAEPLVDRLTFARLIADRQPEWVDRQGWQALDRLERHIAKGGMRGRIKLVDIEQMLSVALPARRVITETV